MLTPTPGVHHDNAAGSSSSQSANVPSQSANAPSKSVSAPSQTADKVDNDDVESSGTEKLSPGSVDEGLFAVATVQSAAALLAKELVEKSDTNMTSSSLDSDSMAPVIEPRDRAAAVNSTSVQPSHNITRQTAQNAPVCTVTPPANKAPTTQAQNGSIIKPPQIHEAWKPLRQ